MKRTLIVLALLALPAPSWAASECPRILRVFGICDQNKAREGHREAPRLPQALRPTLTPQRAPAAPAGSAAPNAAATQGTNSPPAPSDNGHGNDPGHTDPSNPGKGQGNHGTGNQGNGKGPR
jgi:hypothetical protein